MAYVAPFDIPELSYADSLRELHSALRFGIEPMLESVEDMLKELGNPEASYRCVQIAGTNGKTSTARYTAAILAGEGLNCALYTSPELVSYNERMEVAGKPVSQEAFARGISAAQTAGARVNKRRRQMGERPYDITEFDTLTVAALFVFAEAEVDVAVLECGMGGRWDATSAATSIEAVAITGIGLDHTRILGDTLEKIAGEKAAIIKPGRHCVLGVGTATPDSVEDVFLEQCATSGVTPVLVRPQHLQDAAGEMHAGTPREHTNLPHTTYAISQRPERLGAALVMDIQTTRASYADISCLKPAYQAANVTCAVALCEEFLGRALNEQQLFDSVVLCPTPGRFDLVRPNPVGLIDACHNPQSVQTFLTAVAGIAPKVENRPRLLCAVLADKDVRGIVRLLASEFPEVCVTQTSSPRALKASELAKLFAEEGKTPVGVYDTVDEALHDLADVPFVACGSITLAGEVAGILR